MGHGEVLWEVLRLIAFRITVVTMEPCGTIFAITHNCRGQTWSVPFLPWDGQL